MTMEINNQQDILRALDTDPAFREAVRRHLLTDDLINLPEKFAAFVTSQQAFNQDLRNDLHRIAGDIGDLKGNVAGRAACDRHEDILAQLDFTLVRMLSNADLNNLANRSDTTGIHRSELLSFYRADLGGPGPRQQYPLRGNGGLLHRRRARHRPGEPQRRVPHPVHRATRPRRNRQ